MEPTNTKLGFISPEIDKLIFANFKYLLQKEEGIWEVYDDERGPSVMFAEIHLLNHRAPEIAISHLRKILTKLQERKCPQKS